MFFGMLLVTGVFYVGFRLVRFALRLLIGALRLLVGAIVALGVRGRTMRTLSSSALPTAPPRPL